MINPTEQELAAMNCADHPGAWGSDCAQCVTVRKAHIAAYGEWTIGDSGKPDVGALFNQWLRGQRRYV